MAPVPPSEPLAWAFAAPSSPVETGEEAEWARAGATPPSRVAWLKVMALRDRGAWGGVPGRVCRSLVGALDSSPYPMVI